MRSLLILMRKGIAMKTTLLVLLLIPALAAAQLHRPGGGGGGSVDTNVVALKSDLVHNATNPSEMPYFNAAGDTLFSRPFYSAPAWTIDSTMVAAGFNKFWFMTTRDSLAVDSLWGIVEHATSAVVRVLWGPSSASMTDSCTDLTVNSTTVGTLAASTKVIPPYTQVYLKITAVTGAVGDLGVRLNARRRW